MKHQFFEKRRHWFYISVVLLMMTFAALNFKSVQAQQQDFLDPEKAFVLKATMLDANTVRLQFNIAAGYYMYQERFAFNVNTDHVSLGQAHFPTGQVKYDPTFDKTMELFFKEALIFVPITAWPSNQPITPFTLTVTGQGCAEAGICYPPMDFVVQVMATADSSGFNVTSPVSGTGFLDRINIGQWSELLFGGNDLRLADVLSSTGAIEIVLLFFVLGMLLALTPCVLPMLPILSVLLVGEQHRVSKARGFVLAMGYVAGMSVVYTALGIAAGLSGAGLAAWLQTPWVLSVFALLLAVLALAMFDVYTLQMPSSIQSRLMAKNSHILGGKINASVLMGALSALIVGPCVAAPLAGALIYISQTGDVWLGGSALFAMAWGMGVPLLLMGASAGKLIPRSGPWMEGVKQFFGALLLATAWWMVSPVLPTWVQILGWAVLAMFTGLLLRPFNPISEGSNFGALCRKTLGLLLIVLSMLWIFGVASGGRSLLQPLTGLKSSPVNVSQAETVASPNSVVKNQLLGVNKNVISEARNKSDSSQNIAHPSFDRVRTVAELERLLKQSTRPVMLDFYADWCVSCKEMEAFTFTDPRVVQRMDQMLLLQVDVTANNADDRALMKKFRLFGPPGIIFFESGGLERKDVRVVGFQEAARFSSTLDRVLK